MFVEKVIPKAKLVLADDYDQAVTMVRNDKAVAMVADYPICMVSVYRYPDAKLGTLEKPISYEPIGVALPPNDPLLVNWVQNFLQTLEKTGQNENAHGEVVQGHFVGEPAAVREARHLPHEVNT